MIKRFDIVKILVTIVQTCMTLNSLTGLVLFGAVVTGFISKMEKIDYNSKNVLMVGQQHLELFRQLKIGFGPYLFGLFSVHTPALIAIVFLAVDYWKLGVDIRFIVEFAFLSLFTGLPMLYTVLLAKDAHSKLQNILPTLRYCIIAEER